ncbi:DNA polymerase epsilon subunit 4 [Schistocerca nitens]|uniref:DNA polymerase epsilon subunit 4 n=1 Tax=Schistocerca nitens TaxID=7011 RepID=UPI00211801A4|nr:DNA polymerase epsilon subunit 4 [Schistocerca nitens]
MDTIEVPLSVNGVDVINVISLEPNDTQNDTNTEEVGEEMNGKEKTLPIQENLEKADDDLPTDEQPYGNANNDQADKAEKLVRLPIGRIKHLMKMDPDVSLATQEAVFLVAKGTELFIESLAKEAYNFTIKGKRKTVQRKDIDAVIKAVDPLVFLEGVLDDLC